MANKIEQHNRGKAHLHLPPAAAAAEQAKQQQEMQRQMQEQLNAARQQARVDSMQSAVDHPSEVQQFIDFTASMAAAAGGSSVIMLGLPNGKRVDILLSLETSKALAAVMVERIAMFEAEQAGGDLAEAA